MREKARKAVYINTDQIVRVMESVGAAKEYATMIALTSGSQDVCDHRRSHESDRAERAAARRV